MKKILILIVLLSILTFSEESQAPDFRLQNLKNKTIRLSNKASQYKLTVITFWATWCTPCRHEMKELNELYKNFQDRDIEILAISVDDPKTVSRVKSYIHANQINYPVLLDTNNEVIRKYNIASPPFTLLIDGNRRIIYEKKGYRKGDIRELKKQIINFLEKD